MAHFHALLTPNTAFLVAPTGYTSCVNRLSLPRILVAAPVQCTVGMRLSLWAHACPCEAFWIMAIPTYYSSLTPVMHTLSSILVLDIREDFPRPVAWFGQSWTSRLVVCWGNRTDLSLARRKAQDPPRGFVPRSRTLQLHRHVFKQSQFSYCYNEGDCVPQAWAAVRA